MTKAKVAIIVLNFNGQTDTLGCLESLMRLKNDQFNADIYLVDNHSTDRSVEIVRAKFPSVELLVNAENLGFSGGNNVGISKALKQDSDWILLLNNDTVVEKNFLDELLKFASVNKKVGILGPALKFKRGFEIFYDLGGVINPLFGRTTHRTVSLLTDQLPRKVDYVSGACMLLKREVVEEIGLLEEKYFFGFEDVEYCRTAKRRGFEIFNVPSSVVEHKISSSIGAVSPTKNYYLLRNNLLFFYRELLFPKNLLGYLYLMVLSLKMAIGSPRQLGVISLAWSDFFRGRFGKKSL